MSTTIVDRRNERPSDRYVSDIDRFKRRNQDEIRDHIRKKINDGSIKDFGKEGADVPIPKKGTHQPVIHHGPGGKNASVRPGNKEFDQGDRFKKPPGGGGGGGGGAGKQGSPGEDGEDGFTYVHVDPDELLSIIFDGAELPNLTKQGGQSMTKPETRPDGFATKGPHSRMDLARTFANKKGEQFAMGRVTEKNLLKALKSQFEILKPHTEEPLQELGGLKAGEQIRLLSDFIERVRPETEPRLDDEGRRLLGVYDGKIRTQKKLATQSGGWREEHMDFRREKDHPTPITQAVMFCLMDVSGSMDEERKAIAKSFYGLLYRFLRTKYNNVDVVFLRHTEHADEVDEDTFFYDKKSGGTVVSSVLRKMKDIVGERYSDGSWNIYGAQASDGGNYSSDNPACLQLLEEILPGVQGFFYVEVANDTYADLWGAYETVREKHPDDFFMGRATHPKDVIPVFRKLFVRQGSGPGARMETPSWMKGLDI